MYFQKYKQCIINDIVPIYMQVLFSHYFTRDQRLKLTSQLDQWHLHIYPTKKGNEYTSITSRSSIQAHRQCSIHVHVLYSIVHSPLSTLRHQKGQEWVTNQLGQHSPPCSLGDRGERDHWRGEAVPYWLESTQPCLLCTPAQGGSNSKWNGVTDWYTYAHTCKAHLETTLCMALCRVELMILFWNFPTQ